jgi:hypothetical protein
MAGAKSNTPRLGGREGAYRDFKPRFSRSATVSPSRPSIRAPRAAPDPAEGPGDAHCITGAAGIDTTRQPRLVRAIARGRQWWQKLLEGTTLEALCKESGVSDRYIQRLLPLAFLAPRVVTDIVEGNYPSDLTLQRLLGSLKLSWRDQAGAMGAAQQTLG